MLIYCPSIIMWEVVVCQILHNSCGELPNWAINHLANASEINFSLNLLVEATSQRTETDQPGGYNYDLRPLRHYRYIKFIVMNSV